MLSLIVPTHCECDLIRKNRVSQDGGCKCTVECSVQGLVRLVSACDGGKLIVRVHCLARLRLGIAYPNLRRYIRSSYWRHRVGRSYGSCDKGSVLVGYTEGERPLFVPISEWSQLCVDGRKRFGSTDNVAQSCSSRCSFLYQSSSK